MDNTLLIKLQHFFEVNTKIKKELYNNVPPSDNKYLDKESICKYTNDLEETLNYIFSELKCATLDFFGKDSLFLKHIENKESMIKNTFYHCGFDLKKLRLFYHQNMSDMNENFINEVKQSCVGYSLFNNPPITKANTINEILHLMHSFIINNEQILQSIPKYHQKTNDDGSVITIGGVITPLFKSIYENFPNELYVGDTNLVALSEKKLLMMVRNRGHALTLEITINNNLARVEYFIPKLCSIKMINALPGINRVNENSIGATGVFETNINDLLATLYNFISKVPTDDDMIKEMNQSMEGQNENYTHLFRI